MEWGDIFEYSNGKLYWKIRPAMRMRVGDLAGTECKGYIQVNCKAKSGVNKLYRAHRIVWEMHHGPIPEWVVIDHINGNGLDNRIENLRVVTQADNQKNKKVGKNNESGVLGVAWYKPSSKWVARISKDGKWSHIGYFDNFEDAVRARREAELEFKYHENHGRR